MIPTKAGAGTSSRKRVPAYVSPSTQSIAITVNGGTPTAQTIDTSSPNCTTPTVISPTTCTVPIAAPVGTDTFTIVTYDQPNTGSGPYAGNVLSNATFQATIVQGQSNVITATLGGVPTSVTVSPLPNSSYLVGATAGGFTAYGDKPFSVAVVSYDADQNPIVGLGAPSLTLQGSSGLSVTAPAAGPSQNVFTFKNVAFGTREQLVATATPTAGTSGQPLIQAIPVLTKHVVAYLANRTNGVVNVYYDETAAPAYVITVPATASGLAVDSQGTVIVPMAASGVAVYENGATAAPTYWLTSGIGNAHNACVDHEGNIYVTDKNGNGGNGQVEMFHAGGQNTVVATYTAGMGGPFACAIDPVDDSLWVENIGTSTVVQFAHGSTTPATQFGLTGGINNSDEGIAFDRFGTMYIGLNDLNNAPQVQVYLNGSHSANFTFNTYNGGSAGFNAPTGIQVDVAGNLWVGTFEPAQGGAVQVFPGYVNASSLPTTLPYSGIGGMIGFAVTPAQ